MDLRIWKATGCNAGGSTTMSSVESSAGTESRSFCNGVLIADDDAMSRRILQSWLEGWGYEVTATEDGATAWKILQQENPPELLILDWVMPTIDGVELCRRIRERQHGSY
jgi:PleD family two-component response regulator